MNIEAIKKKLEAYYHTATPEQVIRELEDLGIEFIDIPEIEQIFYSEEVVSDLLFRKESYAWYKAILVKPEDSGLVNSHSKSEWADTQYAFAA